MDKELDLQKFIHRQRIQVNAMLGLLNSHQSLFVDKMSQIIIHESSDFVTTSSDDELDDLHLKDMNKFAK